MRSRYIPENVIQGKRFLIFKRRNFIEAAIITAVLSFLILTLPLVLKARIILIFVLGGLTFLLLCLGIKGQSLTEYFISLSDFKKYSKPIHYRRLNESDEKDIKPAVKDGRILTIRNNESVIYKTAGFIGDKLQPLLARLNQH